MNPYLVEALLRERTRDVHRQIAGGARWRASLRAERRAAELSRLEPQPAIQPLMRTIHAVSCSETAPSERPLVLHGGSAGPDPVTHPMPEAS